MSPVSPLTRRKNVNTFSGKAVNFLKVAKFKKAK